MEEVVGWFAAGARDLPWRRTRDPWAVLVAEFMLQQTGVGRVLPRYRTFLERFPTTATCAAAPVGEVVTVWQGLGYNRRAVNLHRCAVAITTLHGGQLPTTLDGLLGLPGIGPYTARAVVAFAHERPVGVLDVNVRRALSRLRGRPVTQSDADALATHAAALPGGAWAWNQAVMELGATVCRPRPQCPDCPAAAHCTWRTEVAIEPDTPDPWVRARLQSRFEGSDRQGRGRLVDALRSGPVAEADLPSAMGWPADPERATRVAATLEADGLTNRAEDGTWSLP